MECETRDSSSSDELEHSEDETEIQKELVEMLDTAELLDDERYPPLMIERLKHLEILLTFDIPDTHCIEHRFDRPPNESEDERFESLGVEIKRGYFDPSEDEIIKRNWESFSKIYHFEDPQLFFSLKHLQARQKVKFVQYLGHGLPKRRLYSIFTRFINLYRAKWVGRFTKHEDKLIKMYMEMKGKNKYKELAKILGRDRMSVYRRCVLLAKNGEMPEKIVWTYEKVEEMVRLLVTVCGVDHVEEFRGHLNIKHQFWDLVGIRMGLPKARLVRFWRCKLYTQIFAKRPITRNGVSIHIINWLRKAKIKYWQNIRWKEIGKAYDEGVTGEFLALIFYSLVQRRVPRQYWHEVKATLHHLKQILPLIECRRDRRLQRLQFDGDCKLHLVHDQENCDTNSL
ncbi:uncharacterized protein LOC124551339 isoform X1 [Schistocerca americana]|uniref:uncharacterized protein LOC124551339 isoform X1 n=1 Tax=Schistocerca americana TaxID=7009 RepID=UPI001F4FDCF7|nr:uncharacterized protein LOC124551339 isoform X1 [Schistocerca americana]